MKTDKINAVVVKLNIGMFANSRLDRQITDEVKLKKALGDGSGKWTKYKLPDECLTPIRTFATKVREFHYSHTSPWEEGSRLLSEKARAGYDAFMAEAKVEFFKLVDVFGKQYPNWIEQAKIMHAKTFEHSDYPSWDVCRSTFHIGCEYMPVPKPDHFSADMKTLYGAGLESITEQKINEAVKDTWERLIAPVAAMAEKLSSPDAIFRDSLVENVKEMAELVPALNITNDPKMMEAAKLIQAQLAILDPEVLRDNKVDRKDAAEKAKTLVARFGGIGKRKFAEAA